MKTDLEIKQNVIEEIKWEPILNAARIGVSVKDSVVTLAESVDSYSKKIQLKKLRRKLPE